MGMDYNCERSQCWQKKVLVYYITFNCTYCIDMITSINVEVNHSKKKIGLTKLPDIILWRHSWSSQLYTQLKQLWNLSLKEVQAWTEFEPMICDTGGVLYQMGYQANWELVTLLVCNIFVVFIFLCSSNVWYFIYSFAFFTVKGYIT